MLIVRFYDVLYQLVADHVPLVEIDELDTCNVAQNLPDFNQAGNPLGREIHLSDIAGHDHFGMEAEPREKHFHLLRRGVLRLIENDERIVQGAAPHKPERRNFDIAPLDRTRGPFHIHHVEQGIVQRAEIRIHFCVHIPRQEPELLARLDRRSRENDAAHFLLHESADCHGHGQVGLTCAGWADADHDVVRLDGFDIGFLRRRFRRNETFFSDDRRRVGEELFDRGLGTLPERAQGMSNVVRLEDHSVVDQGGEFREDAFRVASGIYRTVEGEFFSASRETHTEVFFDQLEVPVVVTEQNGGIGAFSEFKFSHA